MVLGMIYVAVDSSKSLEEVTNYLNSGIIHIEGCDVHTPIVSHHDNHFNFCIWFIGRPHNLVQVEKDYYGLLSYLMSKQDVVVIDKILKLGDAII